MTGSIRQQTQVTGAGNRLRATLDGELAKDVVNVGLDGAGRDNELIGNLAVGATRRDELEDFPFAVAERLYQILDFGFWVLGCSVNKGSSTIGCSLPKLVKSLVA